MNSKEINLQILSDDPLDILSSTKPVVEQAQFVSINAEKLSDLAIKVISRFGKGLDNQEMGFDLTGNFDNDIQLIFIEDVVNFCFWAGKGQPKWEVEYPEGNIVSGGWYGLVACFKRGMADKSPILNAKYLSDFKIQDASQFFKGNNDIEIPLLDERAANLHEAGKKLQEKFDGKFVNLLAQNNYDAIKIVDAILENFSSFRDISTLNGKKVKFLKRAQICVNDLMYVTEKNNKKIINLDKLTACADYKLPQVLRMFGIVEYDKSLAEKIDNLVEITHDSREEIEIRATTIWAVELLRQKINKLTASEIDNTIWLISQDIQRESKPYHRTRTIFY